MKKLLAVAAALVIIGIAGASVMADEGIGSQNRFNAKITTMGALGNGLAISQSNPMDFQLLRIGIAGVRITATDQNESVKIGVLYFGDNKYKLKDVVLGNGTANANIYDLNDTSVGSISLTSYPKGDTEIWAGTLSLSGASYNAYVIQAKRLFKPAEEADNIKDYCTNNPGKCMAAMKAVGSIICDPQTDGNCRDKIRTFCEQNPTDKRCKTLGLTYCELHLNDSICRSEIIDNCKLNNSEKVCEKLANLYEKRLEKAEGAISKLPAWVNSVRQRLTIRAGNRTANESGDD